jgi:hypothetical protein
MVSEPSRALRYDERPEDDTPLHTEDLPATPVRDRNIVARAWIEAPIELLRLGNDLPDAPPAHFKRRIGNWLLWRAGPATEAQARYWAAHREDLSVQFTFDLSEDGGGAGVGPSGVEHTRFRTWKEDLRDHQDRSTRERST